MPADLDRFACDARFPGLQLVRLMRHEIERTRLDLRGLRVLTEASVGYRRATAVLAALAGADEVYAVGRDSVASSRRDAEEQTTYFAELARMGSRVKLLPTRLQAPLDSVDVVTDLPGVRPIDESIVRNLAEPAAVSLMRGVAHWRAADVDVATCRRQGVAVAGLDEEAVGVYRYPPLAVLDALLELGVETTGSVVVVAGDAPVVPHVVQALSRLGARALAAAPESTGRLALYGGEKAGDGLGDDSASGRLPEADALVFCPSDPDDRSVRPGAPADAAHIASAAPHLAVVCLDADAALRAFAAAGLRCRAAGGPDGVFDLVPRALVAQHAAGLKVAEVMTRARSRGSSPLAAEQLAAAEAHAELLPKDLATARR